MIREIKTTLAIDGEREFKAALADAGREMRVMNAELRAMSAEFKTTDDAQTYYTKRSEILNSKVRQQQEIVEALTKAVRESAEVYGDTARQTDDYRIRLSNATAKLHDMRREAEQAKNDLENLGNAQIDAAFKEALDEANRSLKLSRSEAKLLGVTYRNNAEDADYLAKRSQNLKEQIAAAEKIYVETAEAMKRSAAATGELSDETVNLKIRTNEARIELTNLRRESEQVNRDLEELGRDSGKIGRQIKRGIGDAAEDTADKLDGMFAKVAQDVNALKSSVAFQTTMNVGEFVMEGIQSVVGFVQENDEYNRQIAITKYNIEKYGHNWDDALNLIIDAAAITANREGAFEAISNLASSGVQDQALMEAAVDALLGVFITTGGALSFESLAEDFRASVVSRVPTGTYAEVLEELLQDVVIEDVEKALGEMKTVDDAFQLALSYLTEGGYQTTTKSFEEQNQEFLDAQKKQEELAKAWADLSTELQPYVTKIITALTSVVDWTTEGIEKVELAVQSLIDKVSKAETAAAQNLGLTEDEYKMYFWQQMSQGAYGVTPNEYLPYKSPMLDALDLLIPSAGAETLPTADLQEYGSAAWQEMSKGMLTASEGDSAVNAAVRTAIAEMSTNDLIEDVKTAGKNLMIEFGNGIADGAAIPINNVANMVNQINAMLSQISMPAFGLGWSGMTGGNIYLYNQQKSLANTISKTIGRGVITTSVSKK